MKLAIRCALLWVMLLPRAGHASLHHLEQLSISGIDHVRLEDWARVNNFQAKWVAPKQELKLTSGSSTLEFTIDSARISFNGTHIWVSAPIAFRNAAAWIAS